MVLVHLLQEAVAGIEGGEGLGDLSGPSLLAVQRQHRLCEEVEF
jgi:hypothetical protein